MSEIIIKNLNVNYGDINVLKDVNLEFNKGYIYGILGPNGAGKTTLLKSILGFKKNRECEITFEALKKRKVSYVPQTESVDWDFPITVEEVVEMGRYKQSNKDIKDKMSELGILNLSKRQIGELSGGQKQRVFLARALARDADVYILDEPFKGLDKTTERDLMSILKKYKKEKTIVMVHHDLKTVADYFDKVVLVNKTVKCFGDVSKVFTSENINETFGKEVFYE